MDKKITIKFLVLVLLLTAKLGNTFSYNGMGKKCPNAIKKMPALSQFFNLCENPETCDCNQYNFPKYCSFGNECVGCMGSQSIHFCTTHGGTTSRNNNKIKAEITSTVSCPYSHEFSCGGECERKTLNKQCSNGKCKDRHEICEEPDEPCYVNHDPDANDWKCGDKCRKETREVSQFFDCDGECKSKRSYKKCGNGECIYRSHLCEDDNNKCEIRHVEGATDWQCGNTCRNDDKETSQKIDCGGRCEEKSIDKKCCNGKYQNEANCNEEEIIEASTSSNSSMEPETEQGNGIDNSNGKVSGKKVTNKNEKEIVCGEGSFACGNHCLEDHLPFVDCDGVCLDKTTLNNGTCPVKQFHTKLIVGLSVGIFFFLSLVSLTYNAVVTCKKYKAIQPVDRNVEFGITEAPSTFCWVIQHIPFYCSDDMRRAVQQQAEMEIESNPDYGMEMDEYSETEYNGTELVDYNDYYGESE